MVAIKDMEMPSCCGDCSLFVTDESETFGWCSRTGVGTEIPWSKKLSNCPLADIEEPKLEKIEQIVDDCDSGVISCEQLFLNLRTILEQE